MPQPIHLTHEQRIALYLTQVAYRYQLPDAPEAGEASIGAAIHLLRGMTLDETIAETQKEIDLLRERATGSGFDPNDPNDDVDLHLSEYAGYRWTALNSVLDDLCIIQKHPERIATDDALTYRELEEKYA